MPCCYNRFETPDVAICTEHVVILALRAAIVLKGGRLVYTPEYIVHHIPICMPLGIAVLLRNIAVLDLNWQESDHYDAGY
jgi:hypothetical protein